MFIKEFSKQVREQMTNCKERITTKNMTVDLAKDCFEVAQAMLENFLTIKKEGGFKNDDYRLVDKTEKDLVFWADAARSIYDGISITTILFKEWQIK